MQGRSSEQPQQWSVHAEFTISHPGMDDPNAPLPESHTERAENGVRMFYTWPPQSNTPSQGTSAPTTASRPGYGFQRGNMMFTTVPPRRPFSFNDPNQRLNVTTNLQDSGYNSELLSPSSFTSTTRKVPPQPYNRRCRSTCSIVLSTTINEQPELEENPEALSQQQGNCGRTHSLRCQTPMVHSERPSRFYGCGDPWCHHSYGEDAGLLSPTQEGERTTVKQPSRANTFTSQDFTIPENRTWKLENRLKDAAVQTFEMVDKCTSPFMRADSFCFKSDEERKRKSFGKHNAYSSRRRTEPIRTPSSFTPDSLESLEHTKRPVRVSPKFTDRKSSASDSKSSDPTKKPRTVHIDVYCTGTEQESDGSSSSDVESKTASSPQTVFESERVRITHSRSIDTDLPLKLKEAIPTRKNLIKEETKIDSDNDDNASTTYPSQISSYSAIPGLSSFSSSVPPSWSAYSMSVDDNDSVANTSWKDTFSDIESLNRSRSSIAPTDSLDFVPRKLVKVESIEEHPDEKKRLQTPSVASLNPSDSFEYANSEDRVRIKRMENLWSTPDSPKPWKSPNIERKHLLQQQKLKEYVEKRLSNINISTPSKESDSGSDSSEKGWSFVKDDDKKLHRDMTVRRTSKEKVDTSLKRQTLEEKVEPQEEPRSTTRSPSVMAIQEKLYLNPTLRAPFMVVPGIFTDQRYVARKFGSVVNVFKKPGHHVGPIRNPECHCDHCRSFYENGGRGRARSIGEVPTSFPWKNWRSSRLSQPRE